MRTHHRQSRQAAWNTVVDLDEALLSYLACPRCASDLVVASTSGSGQDIISGSLDCTGCGAAYPIVAGIPRLSTSTEGLENVARAFACEWKAHHGGQFEAETLYGKTLEQDWKY